MDGNLSGFFSPDPAYLNGFLSVFIFFDGRTGSHSGLLSQICPKKRHIRQPLPPDVAYGKF